MGNLIPLAPSPLLWYGGGKVGGERGLSHVICSPLAVDLSRCPSVPDLGDRICGGVSPCGEAQVGPAISGPDIRHCLCRAPPGKPQRNWHMGITSPYVHQWPGLV